MLIEIKDLKIGDEIIVPSQGNLKYLRILRQPTLGKRISYRDNTLLYKGVRCSARREDKSYMYGGRKYTQKYWACTPEEHNIEIYQNLNYRTIWLVKRERE